ncbi:uncharacterized protein E6C27_scaffold409G00180 [Cucumis melo var. makuwa]|uniref:Retrotransposon gag domain-containing protein n=1 Tax=Cucumis melo var. makuwa TaxID=1194695 RepID=A0A5A7UT28_CUCMM|nr:uncharacterized protein E6C27_scaffold409G00180 [Cucumis melo var. makuwa]
MTCSSNLEFPYFEDLNREVRIIKRERREENSIPNLSNQEPLRGLEPSLDSPLDPNLGRGNMSEVREKTLRELAEPNEDQRPLCMVIPPTTQPFELKSRLIHLLPIFKGNFGEDPHKHLKGFHMVCDSMRPHDISKEQLNLRAFPFSLTDVAKRWFYYLESGSITTWGSLKKKFLEKFFLASKANNIRKEIYGIRQAFGESLSEYWERFKELCASFPHHHIFDL